MATSDQFDNAAFQRLTPDKAIEIVEKALDIQCTNLCRPLNSYINRVMELETKTGDFLIAKFYRPGRWSKAALEDEHSFLCELHAHEIPVVAPLPLRSDQTLGHSDGFYFAIFPKKSGRSFDEFVDEQWFEIGRLLGRTHLIGAKKQPQDRVILSPDKSLQQHISYLLRDNFIPTELIAAFQKIMDELIAEISPKFIETEMIRLHGDCHFSNLIYRPGESFILIDFDDMVLGPPVQDLWMLLPGYIQDSMVELDLFLEGYETFRPFDRRSLGLIEPLRAMRYVHYTAWCAHQVAEDGFSRVAPDFGSTAYWQAEIRDLNEQLIRIKNAPANSGNMFF